MRSVLNEGQSRQYIENLRTGIQPAGDLRPCCHECNRGEWGTLVESARRIGLNVRANTTSISNQWEGYWSYVILVPDLPNGRTRNYARNQRMAVFHTTAPFSRYYAPAKSREAECISELRRWVEGATLLLMKEKRLPSCSAEGS